MRGPNDRGTDDVVVRMTTTNTCGSDLRMYEGRTDVEQGKVLGHDERVDGWTKVVVHPGQNSWVAPSEPAGAPTAPPAAIGSPAW